MIAFAKPIIFTESRHRATLLRFNTPVEVTEA